MFYVMYVYLQGYTHPEFRELGSCMRAPIGQIRIPPGSRRILHDTATRTHAGEVETTVVRVEAALEAVARAHCL